eukprot:16428443-Heterocapsa_arctica.AAC.1
MRTCASREDIGATTGHSSTCRFLKQMNKAKCSTCIFAIVFWQWAWNTGTLLEWGLQSSPDQPTQAVHRITPSRHSHGQLPDLLRRSPRGHGFPKRAAH